MTIVNEDFDITFIIFSALSALNLNEGVSLDLDPVSIKGTSNNVFNPIWYLMVQVGSFGMIGSGGGFTHV